MKKYKERKKCYCGGYESCDVCNPDRRDKKRVKRSRRKDYKQQVQKELLDDLELRSENENRR